MRSSTGRGAAGVVFGVGIILLVYVPILARLARLFRHTVRVGGVNPLLHLMPRFRKEPKP